MVTNNNELILRFFTFGFAFLAEKIKFVRFVNSPMDSVVKRLKQGDTQVYREIVKNRYTYFYNLACAYMQDHVVAEEVVQDVFVKLWESRMALADDTIIDSWLAILVRNRSIDYIRSRKLHLENQEEYMQYTADDYWVENSRPDAFAYEDLLERTQKAISELPEASRRVFEMSRMEEMTYKEIALRAGISEKTVEYHISKALKILREKLLTGIFILLSLGYPLF